MQSPQAPSTAPPSVTGSSVESGPTTTPPAATPSSTPAAKTKAGPPDSVPASLWVSKDARVLYDRTSTGQVRYDVSLGHGIVIHPMAVIDARKGPIQLGDYCIVEEGTVLANASSDGKPMVIGKCNRFGPCCEIQCASIGSGNVFMARSVCGKMSRVGDRCHLMPRAKITHDEVLTSETLVVAEGQWIAHQAAGEHPEVEIHKLSTFLRRTLR